MQPTNKQHLYKQQFLHDCFYQHGFDNVELNFHNKYVVELK